MVRIYKTDEAEKRKENKKMSPLPASMNCITEMMMIMSPC